MWLVRQTNESQSHSSTQKTGIRSKVDRMAQKTTSSSSSSSSSTQARKHLRNSGWRFKETVRMFSSWSLHVFLLWGSTGLHPGSSALHQNITTNEQSVPTSSSPALYGGPANRNHRIKIWTRTPEDLQKFRFSRRSLNVVHGEEMKRETGVLLVSSNERGQRVGQMWPSSSSSPSSWRRELLLWSFLREQEISRRSSNKPRGSSFYELRSPVLWFHRASD